MEMEHDEFKHRDRGPLIGGLIVFGVGVLFLLINLDIIPGWRVAWPIILIIVGAALIIASFRRKNKVKIF
ncbi:conserved hypothetical protein [Candidatus Zixiibacteriota bacterium]|nr:conserved hypothetical protein [candidate division Zixibacteria bacterium]